MARVQLENKDTFNPEEAIEFYRLSRRKFRKLLSGKKPLPFVAFYGTRKLIIRSEFEKYMAKHPEIMEEIRNVKEKMLVQERFKAPGPAQG